MNVEWQSYLPTITAVIGWILLLVGVIKAWFKLEAMAKENTKDTKRIADELLEHSKDATTHMPVGRIKRIEKDLEELGEKTNQRIGKVEQINSTEHKEILTEVKHQGEVLIEVKTVSQEFNNQMKEIRQILLKNNN